MPFFSHRRFFKSLPCCLCLTLCLSHPHFVVSWQLLTGQLAMSHQSQHRAIDCARQPLLVVTYGCPPLIGLKTVGRISALDMMEGEL